MKNYKALMVKNATHLKIAVAAKQEGLTIDEYLNQLKDCEVNCGFHGNLKPKKNK